jgi:hypothetical protein
MAKDRAVIKGGEVKSVHVGQKWIEISIRIPTGTVVRRGASRNPKPPNAMKKKNLLAKAKAAAASVDTGN